MIENIDEILLDNLKRGEILSLGVLYERYKIKLFNYFLKTTKDYDISNDLLMETFERIYKYRNSYKSVKNVRPWIYQIASNLIKDHFKKSGKMKEIAEMKMEVITVIPDSEDDKKYRNKQLMVALGKLNPSERNIINMYYLLEMGYKDIAVNQDITENNARIKVCRALKKLKELLKYSEL
jgi:RNA polymerase sigma-70 factor (ECF subfamily)